MFGESCHDIEVMDLTKKELGFRVIEEEGIL